MVKVNSITCNTAKLFYYDILCNKAQVDKKVLAHIDDCLFCRQQIQDLQNMLDSEQVNATENILSLNSLLETHFQYISKPVTCAIAKKFFPQLTSSIKISIPTPITAHIDNCEACKEGLKKFIAGPETNDSANQISGTKQEYSSDTITIFKIDAEKAASVSESNYSTSTGFPIKVEIVKSSEQVQSGSRSGFDFMGKLKNRFRQLNMPESRNFIKIAASFTIISALIYVFFLNAYRAEAVTLQYVYEALARISNVHIIRSLPEGQIQAEQWISRDKGLYILKTENQLATYDTAGAVFSIYSKNGQIETYEMTQQQITGAKQNIENVAVIMPYHSIAEFPADTRFEHIPNDMTETAYSGHTVYRLTWDESTMSGSKISRKWELFLDPLTELPSLIRIYRQKHDNGNFEFARTIIISYPAIIDPEAIQSVFLTQ